MSTRTPNMSSLSRRACYKCGELGHHAEACSSPHRLCYNCMFSSALPWNSEDRTNSSIQANSRVSHVPLVVVLNLVINSSDHESSDCPLPRTTEAKQCYHCQGLGHVQADCPTLRLSGTGSVGRCYNCGLTGHFIVRNPPEECSLSTISDCF
ncbi:hypothetical protein B0T25DRAFT_297211 [Lasiosphaeria hispida]|uniref:CCHC-type domain-containing protein n=1 Tax=Lasiosphaeria hispida TaxID=260671 RepID=A0AAJ0HCY3_9PEZI|nr:hypothetical protein B0T25DRAFT_297211 [Lasiosphaeria hispida]